MSLLTESVPYEEAARIVADKQIMSKAAFDALCDELKARAFVVTGLEDLRAVQEIRSSHAALDGLILPADDPFWKDHFPPWEWNCRCQVVGVTQEEYDGARTVGTFDASDPDAKASGWKLTPALHERLSQGQLDDGSGHPVMVTRTGSFHFDPSGPGLDLAEIQKRYDPADWTRFKTAMKAEKLADGRSVWDWANGVKAAAKAAGGPPALPGETGRTATPRQDGDGAEKVWEAPAVQTGMRNAAREALKESQKTGVEVAALVVIGDHSAHGRGGARRHAARAANRSDMGGGGQENAQACPSNAATELGGASLRAMGNNAFETGKGRIRGL